MKQLYTPFYIFALLFLAASFLIRINLFNDPSYAEDTNNDYLIARHLAFWHEHTLIGSLSAGLPSFLHSPIYYYVLTGLVLVNDNILFLGLINILGQLVILICIYTIARLLFSRSTGIIAVLLYALSQEGLFRSSFIWAPRIMELFLYLGFTFAVLGYVRKKNLFILLSIPLTCLAAAIYNAAFAVLPFLIILSIVMLYQNKAKLLSYIALGTLPLLSYALFYAPVYMYLYKIRSIYLFNIPRFSTYVTPTKFLTNVADSTHILFQRFFFLSDPVIGKVGSMATIILIFCTAVFLLLPGKKSTKAAFFVLIAFIAQQIFFIAFLNNMVASGVARYLMAIDGLFLIAIASTIDRALSGSRPLRAIKILCVVAFIFVFSYFRIGYYIMSGIFRDPFGSRPYIYAASRTVEEAVKEIKQENRFDSFSFFTVVTYKNGLRYSVADALLWAPLEKILNNKFTTSSYNHFNHYVVTNSDEYIFVVCYQTSNIKDEEECLKTFKDEYPSHAVGKNIFKDYASSIYLAVK